jgi:hypothetical protein
MIGCIKLLAASCAGCGLLEATSCLTCPRPGAAASSKGGTGSLFASGKVPRFQHFGGPCY